MNFFDDMKIKKMLKKEIIKVPDTYMKSIDQTLNNLKSNKKNAKQKWQHKYYFNYAIATLAIMFVLLTNISPQISYAMQEIPIIGKIVKIVTIRNYFDKNGNSEIDLEIPNVKNSDNSQSATNEKVNEDVNTMIQKILDDFYSNINSENHLSVKVESEVVENSENWFTLKLTESEVAGSSDVKYKYYHIDKRTDIIVELSDLFSNTEYKNAINEEIKRQMISQMKEDESIIYWINEEDEEWNFRQINDNQNFYFSDNGNIVIVFDKYEVGPGSTGTPEFEISKKIYEKYLKEDYR